MFINLESFKLYYVHTKENLIRVSAEIKNGLLVISGHDLGDAPKEFFGLDEYEYWYKFNRANTDKLIRLLLNKDSKTLLFTEEDIALRSDLLNAFDDIDDLKTKSINMGMNENMVNHLVTMFSVKDSEFEVVTEKEIKDIILEKFGGENSCEKMRSLCSENDIEFDFSSWVTGD